MCEKGGREDTLEVIYQWKPGLQKRKLLGWSAGWTEMSPCVTYETEHPGQGQSSGIVIPEKSQREGTAEDYCTAKDISNALF